LPLPAQQTSGSIHFRIASPFLVLLATFLSRILADHVCVGMTVKNLAPVAPIRTVRTTDTSL